MLAFSGLASKFNKLIGCHFTRVLCKYNTLEPCQDAVICSLNSSTASKQSYLLYSCICTAVNSLGWHCHICMLSNLPCSCIWSAPYMLQTLQEVLPILVPDLALWSSHILWRRHHLLRLSTGCPGSCLKMHGGYVAVEHLGRVAVFSIAWFLYQNSSRLVWLMEVKGLALS